MLPTKQWATESNIQLTSYSTSQNNLMTLNRNQELSKHVNINQDNLICTISAKKNENHKITGHDKRAKEQICQISVNLH